MAIVTTTANTITRTNIAVLTVAEAACSWHASAKDRFSGVDATGATTTTTNWTHTTIAKANAHARYCKLPGLLQRDSALLRFRQHHLRGNNE